MFLAGNSLQVDDAVSRTAISFSFLAQLGKPPLSSLSPLGKPHTSSIPKTDQLQLSKVQTPTSSKPSSPISCRIQTPTHCKPSTPGNIPQPKLSTSNNDLDLEPGTKTLTSGMFSGAATPEKALSRSITPDQLTSSLATTTPDKRKSKTSAYNEPIQKPPAKTLQSSPMASPKSKSPEFQTPSHTPTNFMSKIGETVAPKDSVSFVDETVKQIDSPRAEVKETSMTFQTKAMDGDMVVSRPVVPERTGEGMLPPPPAKQKSPAPPPPETKVT